METIAELVRTPIQKISPQAQMTKCKGCGREIFFARNKKSGSVVPLETAKHLYVKTKDNTEHRQTVEPIGESDGFVIPYVIYQNHFITCSKANNFSGRTKRTAQS